MWVQTEGPAFLHSRWMRKLHGCHESLGQSRNYGRRLTTDNSRALLKAHMIGWRMKVGFDASWSLDKALPNRLKPMHKTTRCPPRTHSRVDSDALLFPHLLFIRACGLKTRIGRQEYRKDSFCLESVGGGGIQKN